MDVVSPVATVTVMRAAAAASLACITDAALVGNKSDHDAVRKHANALLYAH